MRVEQNTRAWGWIAWSTAIVFVLFQFYLQLSSGIIVDQLMSSFSVTAVGASLLASSFYYMYVVMQIPSGLLTDRFGARLPITIGAVFCTMGCFVFAKAQNIYLAELGRLLMGLGCSVAFVCSIYLIRQWFEPKRFAFMVGLVEMLALVGTIVGMVFMAKLLATVGWREIIVGSGMISIVIAFACAALIKDKPDSADEITTPSKSTHFLIRLSSTMKNPMAWVGGLYGGLMFSVITVFGALWAIPYIMIEMHVGISWATTAVCMVFVGGAIGSPVWGYITSNIGHRRTIMMFTPIACAILFFVLLHFSSVSFTSLFSILFLLGFFSSPYMLSYSVTEEVSEPFARSTATGFCNTLTLLTAPVFQPLIGYLLEHMAKLHTVASGASHYNLHDYQYALLVMPIAMLVATVLGYLLPESK